MFIITSWDPVASGFAWNPWDAFHGSGANETLQLWGRSIPGQHHPWNTLHESWHTGFNPLWCLLQIQNVKSHIGKSTCNYWNWFKYWHIVESTLGMGEHQFVIGGSDLVNPSVVYGCMHQNHSPQEWMIILTHHSWVQWAQKSWNHNHITDFTCLCIKRRLTYDTNCCLGMASQNMSQ